VKYVTRHFDDCIDNATSLMTLDGAAELLIPHILPDFIQAVLDAMPTPVFFKDREGVYQGCNRAFGKLLGRRRSEILGLTVFELSPPEYAQAHAKADVALMQSGGEQRYEALITRCDGERLFVVFHKAAVRGLDGEIIGIVGTILDITDRKALEVKLADLAERDALTGLLNRRAILSYLEALHEDRRKSSQTLCLMMCDVDHFKSINDRYGHGVGDEVLKRVAHVLRSNLRDADRVGRIGGEEFLVVLGTADMDDARQVAERLRHLISQLEMSCDEGKTSLSVTISIGLTQSQVFDDDWASVVSRADQGLYKAKRSGRDCVIVADALMRVEHRKDWHCDS
jgi:diguanylate cyclase (GGDEF)-like protein/PAS domain S-box-containing protein